MLNFIRQKREHMKWVLWPVIIALGATMLLLFVPTRNASQRDKDLMSNIIAKVGDKEIPVQTFNSGLRTMMSRVDPERRRDPNTMRNIGMMALQRIIQMAMMSQEAERYGFKVSENDVEEAITNDPSFRSDSDFTNYLKWREITEDDLKDEVRCSLLAGKLQEFITSAATVSDSEVSQYYLQLNDQAQIKYVAFSREEFFNKVAPDPAKMKVYFDSHPDKFKLNETRQIRYLLLTFDKTASAISQNVTEKEIQDEYDAHIENYPNTIRASHILINVDQKAKGEEVDAAKKKAESILAELRAGGDFAALATKYSDDKTSAAQGGDLGYFSRGEKGNEFDETAFYLKVGEIAGPVRTKLGFQLIKKTDTRDLNFYKSFIVRIVARQKAESMVKDAAQQAYQKVQQQQTKDLAAVAKEFGGTVETSKPFNREKSDPALGQSKEMNDEVFQLKVNEFGQPFKAKSGYTIPQLIQIVPPHIPPYDEVKMNVERSYRTDEAERLAKEQAERFHEAVKKSNDLDKTASSADFKQEVTKTAIFYHGSNIDRVLGSSPEITQAIFNLEKDAIGGPVKVSSYLVVFQVINRQHPDMAAYESRKAETKETLLSEKRQKMFKEFFSTVYSRYVKDNRLVFNDKLINRIIGG